jgi:periplasmic divalent cation tolerance protein
MVAVDSCYRWQGSVTKDAEFLLLIKTAAHFYPEEETALIENHSYEIPEIIQIPVTRGLPAYLAWMDENTKSP